MSEKNSRWCVFLPCSTEEIWAIPQNCLAEIVTFHDADNHPPQTFSWRGQEVPVMDLGSGGDTPWRDPVGGTGLIAVILGLEGQKHAYWAIALRGEGLAVKNLAKETLTDTPENTREHSSSAFQIRDVVYQVPDLPELQKKIDEIRLSA
ncbi:MAG: hypothetical protein V7746_03745 [Halioglobus sp.]